MRITRLAQGVDATRVLAPEAIQRTVSVLEEFRAIMDSLGARKVRLVATSAARDAANGNDFLARASAAIGGPADVLDGTEEGRLAFAGATSGLTQNGAGDLVVDIGGGSTELVLGRAGRVQAISLDIGCVRLTERHLVHDPPTKAEMDATVTTIRSELARATERVADLGHLDVSTRLIGVAGTVSTLASLSLGLSAYVRDRVHHHRLTVESVSHWCTLLGSESAARRLEHPGMVEGRQDVILGGALVLREVMERFGFDTCLVSESDILDGLAGSLRDHSE
jgi:exopolyphosphatase / guanosine-5'-triphosphate,3'-diphosphate pyrophosphatase